MTSFNFETTTYGKWILAGEHAVLRGHGALVFPLLSKTLVLKYRADSEPYSLDVRRTEGLYLLFENVLEHGLALVGRTSAEVSGLFSIENTIPIGVGMGASAALCVAVARWFVYQHWVPDAQLLHFATELEHLFHGKSSGLDIVGVSATTGQFFQHGMGQPLQQSWQPRWMLSSCGQKSMTADCILQVQNIWTQNATDAALIDEKMSDSVDKAKRALLSDERDAWPLLIESVAQAASCFQAWGLINEPLEQHMQSLLHRGASAVKPTGSGGGGYVLSLWKNKPLIDQESMEDDWVWIDIK